MDETTLQDLADFGVGFSNGFLGSTAAAAGYAYTPVYTPLPAGVPPIYPYGSYGQPARMSNTTLIIIAVVLILVLKK